MPSRTYRFTNYGSFSLGTVQVGLLAVAGLLVSCGDASQAEANDGAAEAGGAAVAAVAESPARDASQDTVTYNVGDVYEYSGFSAKYLGMAKLPLGTGRVYTDGTCVTLLFEATYRETPGSRSRFSPTAKGYLNDGREAERDNTGVGCETKGIRALGYESAPRHRFQNEETTKLFLGAIHIPDADAGQLAWVTLGGDDRTRMAVEIVAEPETP